MKVLVVDDNFELREFMCEVFEESGYQVRQASDGLEALALHRVEPADIWFLDVFMPNLDGLETIKQLRQEDPDTPVVCMSANSEKVKVDYTAIGKRFGATEVLPKPFAPTQLIEMVEKFVETAPAS